MSTFKLKIIIFSENFSMTKIIIFLKISCDHAKCVWAEDMGVVCWAPNSSSGYTFHKGLRLKGKNLISDCQGISGPVAICDMSKFRSNYEVNPLIWQKLNFPMFLSDAKEVIEAWEESGKIRMSPPAQMKITSYTVCRATSWE